MNEKQKQIISNVVNNPDNLDIPIEVLAITTKQHNIELFDVMLEDIKAFMYECLICG